MLLDYTAISMVKWRNFPTLLVYQSIDYKDFLYSIFAGSTCKYAERGIWNHQQL